MTDAQESRVRYRFSKPYADVVARLRVPGGFLLLLAFAALSRPSGESMLIGLPVSMLGLLLRGWAAGHLAKNECLAVSGPYAYIRNPLYAGTVTVALGIVIAARSVLLACIAAVVFSLVYLPVVELEEQHLREIFPQYAAYAARVRRFLPRKPAPPLETAFSWKLYRKNEEYKALLGFLLAVAWLAARSSWLRWL
jgi:protein-S-isoprenylcysteine O-methyltransferase Ste14